MARVVFWSPTEQMTGCTHAIIAVSTIMGMKHKATSLLMHGNYNSKKIESAYTPYSDLVESKVLENSNIGMSALVRLVTSNKLTADAIQNYAKPVLKERLDILYGMNSGDKEGYLELVNKLPYITRKASEVYDLIFLDLPKKREEKFVKDTLADAEIIVCVVNQDAVKLDRFFDQINNMEEIKNKPKLLVIADYEDKSKYNVFNIKNRYRVKEPLYVIPHNLFFTDACNDGSVIDFLYRNINAESRDYNGFFIEQVSEIAEKIVEIAKIKDN